MDFKEWQKHQKCCTDSEKTLLHCRNVNYSFLQWKVVLGLRKCIFYILQKLKNHFLPKYQIFIMQCSYWQNEYSFASSLYELLGLFCKPRIALSCVAKLPITFIKFGHSWKFAYMSCKKRGWKGKQSCKKSAMNSK